MPQPRFKFYSAFLLFSPFLVARLLAPLPAAAATWSADASVSLEKETNITEDGSESTETFEQSYTVTYETDLTPVLSLGLEFALDITDEINEPDYDTRDITPSVDLDLQAVWWDVTASWEQSKETSNDPTVRTTRDISWDVEVIAEPGTGIVPDVQFSYARDTDKESQNKQTIDESLEASLDYTFWDWIDLTFDVSKDSTDDKVNPDSDTEDRDYSLEISLDHEFGDRIQLEAEWTNEREQSVTLSDDDDVLERDDTLTNNLRGQITFIPWDPLELTLEREVNWDKDLEVDTLEVTDTWDGSASFSQPLTETIEVDLSYEDEREDTRDTGSDSYRITQDYSASLIFSPLVNLSITPTFDRTKDREWFDDPTVDRERSIDDTWEIELDAALWDDRVELTVVRSFQTTTEQGNKTTHERNWDIDTVLTFDTVPNLEITPGFTYTEDEDLLKQTTDEEREIEVGLSYELSLNDVFVVTLDHTYTRTSDKPGEGEATISRDDDTDITVSWIDFFAGMGVEFGFTRTASDESKDDKNAEIDYTYSVTYDWTFLDQYTISFEYDRDANDESEDTQEFVSTISMEFLDGLLTIDFEHEFDEQLDGDKDETHRYFIEIQGQF